jgi:hypothetical protein
VRSALKMETGWFSRTLVSTYKSTWQYNPQYQHTVFKLYNVVDYLIITLITNRQKERKINKENKGKKENYEYMELHTAISFLAGNKVQI